MRALKKMIARLSLFALAVLFLTMFGRSSWATCNPTAGEHCVNGDMIPQISWTRGCSPTSASMVLGYWDMYNPGIGYYGGYGNLIEYWQDLSYYSDGSGSIDNVPSVLDQLRVAMKTDVHGLTLWGNIGPGITYVTNTMKGYCFSSNDYSTNSQWCGAQCGLCVDHCWSNITNEINYGRPFVWSMYSVPWQEGHSVAAWGYTDDKYVITYNTWWSGQDNWYYASWWDGVTDTTIYQQVTTVVPGCPKGNDNIYLYKPQRSSPALQGGQSFTITWLAWPPSATNEITSVDLMYSTDGGVSWIFIAQNVPSVDGWNNYNWYVPFISSNTVRVWVKGFDANRNYVAGDGSGSPLTASYNIPYSGDMSITSGSCPAAENYDPVAQTCQCPFAPDQNYDPVANACVCPNGETWDPYAEFCY